VILLLLVSFVWAFSFGLIKGRLGGLDTSFISAVRLGLAMLVFLPFLRLRGIKTAQTCSLLAVGAVQFGLMYLAYNASFKFLPAHEVALFTLTTPIFVTLAADALEKTFRWRALVAALIAVAGAAVVIFKNAAPTADLKGVLLVQASNITFAVGQVFYRRIRLANPTLVDRNIFALLYAGGVAVTLPVALYQSNYSLPTLAPGQLWTLLYLGVIASGLCFFGWNYGSTRVSTGLLAVFNNAKIPLAVACSLLVFGEHADVPRLLASAALLVAALWLARRGE